MLQMMSACSVDQYDSEIMKFYPSSVLRLEIFFVEIIDDRRFLSEIPLHSDVKSETQSASIFKHIPI